MMNLQVTPEDLFTLLRAELEGEWLEQCFVPPEGFEPFRGKQSVLLFGAEGGGKSAMIEYIVRQSLKNPAGPLIARWKPAPSANPDPLQSINLFRHQTFQELGVAALGWAGRFPQRVSQAPQWAQSTWITWVDNFVSPLLKEQLLYEYPVLGNLLPDLQKVKDKVSAEILANPSLETLRAWINALRSMGCLNVWVIVEGLEMWESPESDFLIKQIQHLLGSMVWFEQENFTIKIIVPERYSPVFLPALHSQNKRIQPMSVRWNVEKLKQVVERRLHYLTGKPEIGLETLVQGGLLLEWVKRFGGLTPRGWLAVSYPFVKAFWEKKLPLSAAEGEEILRKDPPRLRLDSKHRQAILGYSAFDVSPQSYDLLEFLYHQPDFSCSKEELYYKAIRRLSQVPREGDPAWESPAEWWGVMDTALWRLRKDIELDPQKPMYVISERRKGIIRLNEVW